MVQRTQYLNTLKELQGKHVIKAITGVRRCGKSHLLKSFASTLPQANVVYIDLDLWENAPLRQPDALHAYLLSRLHPDSPTTIILDEAQRCEHFEDVVESLFARDNTDLYITGSNADMLSGDLATLLAGRYVEIGMLPMSFSEYLAALDERGRAQGTDAAFRDYVRWGGFPEIIHFTGNDDLAGNYLDGIFNTVLVRDIVQRHNIRDVTALTRIARYLADNIGSLVSAKKIADSLTSAGHKTTQPTVENYLSYLIDGRLFYEAERYRIKGKDYLKTLSKYYIVDTGLRNYAIGFRGNDTGHLLENTVYLELLRRGYDVSVGNIGTQEIDFVARKGTGMCYVQVSQSVTDPQTLRRELDPLRSTGDFHPRVLLTLDYDIQPDYDGIASVNAIEWLSGQTAGVLP